MKGRVYKRAGKKGAVWAIDYADPSGRRVREIVGSSKALAQEVLNTRLGDMARGVYHLSVKKGVTVRAFKDEYLKAVEAKGRVVRRHKASLKVLVPFFGDMALDKITLTDLVRFRVERQRTMKPATVNRDLACLRNMFNVAKRLGKVGGDNPVASDAFVKESPKIKRDMTAEELAHLLTCFDAKAKHARLVAVVVSNTGLRHTEATSLRWDGIDFEGSRIVVEKTKGGAPHCLRLTPTLRAELQVWPKVSEYVFPSLTRKDKGPQKERAMGSIKRAFATAVEKAVKTYPALRGTTLHHLRHHAGRVLIRHGASVVVAQALYGHKDPRTTMRYLNVESEDYLKLAAEALEDENAQQNGTNLAQEPFRPEAESKLTH